MRTARIGTSSCCCCQFYTPEGRRGGQCSKLSVPVRSSWKACCLAIPAFAAEIPLKRQIEIWSQDFLMPPAEIPDLETSDNAYSSAR
ncbi:MAG: hypothetical protein F6K04_07340 [Leptolyngbya sp. SIO4C5]|uniref:hypothetical protein n=1 Tax=Sphaerothrix gracilis TaxID=3151835 RepID=UPI0013BEE662|nr:hypothetical protein [Leptolyngbya sp. SIO4C5]